jgi:hypothetical protein
MPQVKETLPNSEIVMRQGARMHFNSDGPAGVLLRRMYEGALWIPDQIVELNLGLFVSLVKFLDVPSDQDPTQRKIIAEASIKARQQDFTAIAEGFLHGMKASNHQNARIRSSWMHMRPRLQLGEPIPLSDNEKILGLVNGKKRTGCARFYVMQVPGVVIRVDRLQVCGQVSERDYFSEVLKVRLFSNNPQINSGG